MILNYKKLKRGKEDEGEREEIGVDSLAKEKQKTEQSIQELFFANY